MRLQQYINESKRSTPIHNIYKIPKMLKGKFSQAWKQFLNKREFIYRDRPYDNDEFVITNPRKKGIEKRKSPWADNNFYNLLLNNLPSWDKMPDRDIICTFDDMEAKMRSDPNWAYMVLPKNGAKIGICPSEDIWYSFYSHARIESLNDLNKELFHIDNLSSDKERKLSDKDWKLFQKLANRLDEFKKYDTFPIHLLSRIDRSGIFSDYLNSDIDFISYLDDLLDPKKNGFKVQSVSNFKSNGKSEVWTDSTCLMIRQDMVREVKSEYASGAWF